MYIYIYLSHTVYLYYACMRVCVDKTICIQCVSIYIYITCVAFPGTNLGSMELVSRFLFCHAAMPSVAQHGFTVSVSRRSI